MKKWTILTTILIVAFWMQCFAQKKGSKVLYELPDAMLADVKIEFAKQCDKGLILWTINCARCHNKKDGKKEIIPDFLPEQLIGYELRVKNATHESNLPDTDVTAEELGQIMTFLTYKKKNAPGSL